MAGVPSERRGLNGLAEDGDRGRDPGVNMERGVGAPAKGELGVVGVPSERRGLNALAEDKDRGRDAEVPTTGREAVAK